MVPSSRSSQAANTANAMCSDSLHQRALAIAARIIAADIAMPSANTGCVPRHATSAPPAASAMNRKRFRCPRSWRALASTCAQRPRRTCHAE